jgi:hypothetical protein
MSIVTLKRKSQATYKNVSTGTPHGFSLSGTHRNQGYIGQTSISRSFPSTPMKGNVAKGHGGCCGKYPQGHIIQSAVNSQEDPNVVKTSSLNTRGLIDTKYRWIRRPQPFTTVDKFHRVNTQGDYIYFIEQKTLKAKKADGTPCTPIVKEVKSSITGKKCGGLSRIELPSQCDEPVIMKPEESTGAINSSKYIFALHEKCVNIDEFKLTTTVGRIPFTCGTMV